jgi:hypothetical protein
MLNGDFYLNLCGITIQIEQNISDGILNLYVMLLEELPKLKLKKKKIIKKTYNYEKKKIYNEFILNTFFNRNFRFRFKQKKYNINAYFN